MNSQGSSSPSEPADSPTVSAGSLAPWTVGDLPRPPGFGLRTWFMPGTLLGGAASLTLRDLLFYSRIMIKGGALLARNVQFERPLTV